jgi:L-alanine-DL-glutamate epimerase-like enolase superfamily enzyme
MAATHIVEVTAQDLDIALREPFGIATGAQAAARNLLIRVRLAGGAVGWGEAAPFEAVNGETREGARAAVEAVRARLEGWDARAWRPLGAWLAREIPGAASARCALETAVLDALGRALGLPLWVLFGGSGTVLETDLTVTTGTPEAARAAAARLERDGFRTLKLKVGGVPLGDDLARVEAVVTAAPSCGLLLDANGAMASVDDAVQLVEAARRAGGTVVLFEQPMGRHEGAAMREVASRARVPVAADEGASSAADVVRIAHEQSAQAVNLKIMKSGVVEALEMAAAARTHGLGLMVGGMVESVMAMSTSASLAAGQGGFQWVDLDTPLFMAENPLEGGYVQQGPRIDVRGIAAGHGVRPRGSGAEEETGEGGSRNGR